MKYLHFNVCANIYDVELSKSQTQTASVSLFTANHNVPSLCKSKSSATAAAFGEKTVSVCIVGLGF